MLIRIDLDAPLPLHVQIAAAVRGAIAAGEVDAGERLPSARSLADDLDVNVHTVLRAYQALRDEGLLDLRRGRGATVRAAAPVHHADLVAAARAFAAAAHRLGLSIDDARTAIDDAWTTVAVETTRALPVPRRSPAGESRPASRSASLPGSTATGQAGTS